MRTKGEGSSSIWTWDQNKAFEIGLAIYPENSQDRWQRIAAQIPGHKTVEDVLQHYRNLVHDLKLIESANIPLPYYTINTPYTNSNNKPSSASVENNDREPVWETRKGIPWSEEEHKQFLLGLEKYGKGDWKSISREFVKSRTATQVASHAQKHFKRQAKMKKKESNRYSIFDITVSKEQPDGEKTSASGRGSGSTSLKGKERALVIDRKKTKKKEKVERSQVTEFPLESPVSQPESFCVEGDLDLDLDAELEECLSYFRPSQ